MKKWIVAAALVLLIAISVTGGIGAYLMIRENASFLLVETDRTWHTELVSGNYTDGEMCFDFPTYYIDRDRHRLEDWGNDRQSGFDLVYGSSSSAGGIMESGGASGLEYIRSLPFTEEEWIPWGQSEFFINVTVTEGLDVFVNGTIPLERGNSIRYDYDRILIYHNHEAGDNDTANSTCRIRYVQNSTLTNFGLWKVKDIDFAGDDGIFPTLIARTEEAINPDPGI
jgi:hypothetical protein